MYVTLSSGTFRIFKEPYSWFKYILLEPADLHWITPKTGLLHLLHEPVTDRTDLMKSRKRTDPCFLWKFEPPYRPAVASDVGGKASCGCGKQGAIRTQSTALLTIANSGFFLTFIPGYMCIVLHLSAVLCKNNL